MGLKFTEFGAARRTAGADNLLAGALCHWRTGWNESRKTHWFVGTDKITVIFGRKVTKQYRGKAPETLPKLWMPSRARVAFIRLTHRLARMAVQNCRTPLRGLLRGTAGAMDQV